MLGDKNVHMFNFRIECQTDLQSGCANLQTHQWCQRFHFISIITNTRYLSTSSLTLHSTLVVYSGITIWSQSALFLGQMQLKRFSYIAWPFVYHLLGDINSLFYIFKIWRCFLSCSFLFPLLCKDFLLPLAMTPGESL